MSMKINPPSFKSEVKSYERYKQELLAWQVVTDIPKEKQGIAVALTLPEGDPSRIREKVFDECSLTTLKTETGLDTLIAYLDKKLGKDDLEDSWEKFERFEDYKRLDAESITEYISNFDQRYQRVEKMDMKLPSAILAFKLLRRANISREEKLLVMTGLDYSKKDEMYEQAKKSLQKFKGGVIDSGGASGFSSTAIKLEPVFLAENEEALWNAGYVQRGRWRGRFARGSSFRGPSQPFNGYRGSSQPFNGYRGASQSNAQRGRAVNPNGPDGQPMTCRACGSYRHLIRVCPDSWENLNTSRVNFTERSEDHVVLFTGFDKQAVSQLGIEAQNCAVLDSACSSTVCGQNWIENYLKCLPEYDKAKVIQNEGTRMFRFGGGTVLKSLAEYRVPAMLAGQEITLVTDVVESDIPLLLSRTAMKSARIKLDLVNDTAEIFGKGMALNMTSSGHYCVPIDKVDSVDVENVCAVNMEELTNPERIKVLSKLHRQFAHPPEKRLVSLLKDAGVWEEHYRPAIQKIIGDCELCKVYAKTPSRPVVAMPMAKVFNEKVAMDLKKWDDHWILHMIDMWSRLTVSAFIKRKTPRSVLDKLFTNWIGVFGVMKGIMTDNGGEFSNEEVREVASILNVEVCTSAGESPFQNGLCERVHAVTDMMLVKLQADNPKVSADVLLCWANMARNSLQMWHGYSSHQLVFGVNPNLPNILSDNIPALEGSTNSETFAQHLNTLHSARRAFIQSEADERIRRALRHKVRAAEQVYDHGDRVFYKREGKDRWLGPGKVVFQDGKVVFVRHGGTFVRVSPNRLVKAIDHVVNDTRSDNINIEGDNDNNLVLDPVVGSTDSSDDNPDIMSELIGGDIEVQQQRPSDPVQQQRTGVVPKTGEIIKYCVPELNQWNTATIMSRAGKASGRNKHWFNVRDTSGTEKSVDLSRCQWEYSEEDVNLVLVPWSKQGEPECLKAKLVELEKLRDFDTYVQVEDVGQTRISSKWVIWYKGPEIRARLVARGFEEEDDMRVDSPTVGKSSMRIFLAVAASKGWKIKTTDIKSAFLQGKPMERDVYLVPPKESNTPVGYIWKLKRCLYGLNDAARQFYYSVCETLVALGCIQSSLDPSLFYSKGEDGELQGILVSHIDDFLHTGTSEFESNVIKKLGERFLAGKVAGEQFIYIGFQIHQVKEGITLDQNNYVNSINIEKVKPQRASQKHFDLSMNEHTQLRSLAGKLNWAVQGTRPDMAYDLVEISTKFKNAQVVDLLQVIKSMKHLKDYDCKVFFPNLGPISGWKILLFADASHANLNDGVSSMRAYIIFLVGQNRKCCPLSWNGNKIKRVVRSTIAAETLSLQEGLEDAMYLKNILKQLIKVQELPIIAFVDNRSVVEAVHSTKLVDDKRLRIDIGAIKQSLEKKEISAIRWCPGNYQLADCMTKRGVSSCNLLTILHNGTLGEMMDYD